MKHKTLSPELAGELPVVVLFDRRSAPDRRTEWRGGRRDSDWLIRPSGALDRMAQANRLILAWRTWRKRPQ